LPASPFIRKPKRGSRTIVISKWLMLGLWP
jgi:hypothetical protein